jgi:superfamily II DNA or RNA helicase
VSWPSVFDLSRLELGTNRVEAEDGARQLATVQEILSRLVGQPGVVLADEVGMGKTFVALAVAVAAALADKGRRPVVVMVPASLRDKWPRDWEVFKSLCLKDERDRKLRAASAHSALGFFKLLDDPPSRLARIIFLSHGAFYAGLDDPWVKLAILKRALHGLHLGQRRASLPRFVADLIRTKSSFNDPDLYERLLHTEYGAWMGVINEHARREQDRLDDDPIPAAVQKVLEQGELDLDALRDELRSLPARASANLDDRLASGRRSLNAAMRRIWPQALGQTRFRSPLLILDEAHHLKNPATRLASLFVEPEAKEESDLIAGTLEGGFERMLFLTATPFQLGHHELLNVLDRFEGIAWKSLPGMTRDAYKEALGDLRKSLDEAHREATDFDWKWRLLRKADLIDAAGQPIDAETWWSGVQAGTIVPPARLDPTVSAFRRTRAAMKETEVRLRPWVVRHLRRRTFQGTERPRRLRLIGAALHSGHHHETAGLAIAEDAILPFLLAARSQALVSRTSRTAAPSPAPMRATFAEGLASRNEAFLETRRIEVVEAGNLLDEVEPSAAPLENRRLDRYLTKLESALPSPSAYARHPKMAALATRVVDLWARGEKVVIFCHFRRTGRALVRHISSALDARLWADASRKLGCDEDEARRKVALAGDAFDDGRPLQRVLEQFVMRVLVEGPDVPEAERVRIANIVRRFVRTPLFLGRYLDLGLGERDEALQRALEEPDGSGQPLQDKIRSFVSFIAGRCQPDERAAYLDALEHIQPGLRGERPLDGEAEDVGERLLPNIRLANGGIDMVTRRRLLLAFNTPFFPEILVASSVLAEGVDLHLNCRHIIHYDLSWNPSTIEQRTGRVDRLGAKAEQVKQPINVFLPFVAGTQDEKMFRVVTDRERWFQVVMGEDYRLDESVTDKLAERVPLPEAVAAALAFRLEVFVGGTESQRASR